jgi:hypothetical protein
VDRLNLPGIEADDALLDMLGDEAGIAEAILNERGEGCLQQRYALTT